jgi:hypothetical protein
MLARLTLVAILFAALGAGFATRGGASAAGPTLAIDVGSDGNGPTTIGTIENCISLKKDQQFTADILVRDVSDLIAWETYIEYDGKVVTVVDQNVKLFQQANAGSSVVDLSGNVPDDRGSHHVAGFDSGDPPSPDSGSGVLASVTFRAVGDGDSKISFSKADLDGDGKKDQGTLLRDSEANAIGDTDKDKLFDGQETNAEVAVGQDCPAGTTVAPSPKSDDGSSTSWVAIGGGAAAIVAIGVLGLVLVMSRRRSARRRATS